MLTVLIYHNANLISSINTLVEVDYTNTNDDIFYANDEVSKVEWKLEIPKIELSAQIEEGTTEEILNEYIGHFENTSKNNGNVALAAHNRGYSVNYFARLKELEIGDEIIYTFQDTTKIYEIFSKDIIQDTDVEVLEETNENILTLITCVEDQPSLRRCLKAKEIKDEKGQ